jgi:hypothetical protein
MRFCLFMLALGFSTLALGAQESCPGAETTTTPAAVDISNLKSAIGALSTPSQKKIIVSTPEFSKLIESTFDLLDIKTKMEQFYSLLWILAQKLSTQKILSASFTQSSVENVLLASKVFSDPAVPGQIKTIEFDVSNANKPKFSVSFARKGIEIPLNQGKGFFLFRNGKCQHAQKLIFDQTFTFEMKKNLGNLMVTNFQGVDLFGDFGNRGVIDVDIQYVSLRSVEFFTGTPNGRVTAYVSREEFSKNKHNVLLELVTRIVPDRSVQPIDW